MLTPLAHPKAADCASPVGPPGSDWSRRLMWPALAMWALAKAWLSWGRYLNQDEFETLHQGWLIFNGGVPYRDFNSNHPPLAFELLGWLNYLTTDPATLILLARGLTFLSAAVVLYLLFRISRDVFGDRAARWTVIVYAVNATFWEWSTEVRTDFLMVPLWLAAVSLLFSPRPRSLHLRMVAIGLLMGTAFWVNQKVVLHAAPIGVFMLLGGPKRKWNLRHVAVAVAASLVPALVVLGRAWLNGSLSPLVQHNFLGPCAWGLVESNYYGSWRWVTLKHAFQRDLGFVFLSLAAIVWGRAGRRTSAQYFILVASVWMLATLFLTPGPFQYYLLSVFPLFAVAIGGLLSHVQAWAESRCERPLRLRHPAVVVAMVFFVTFPLIRLTRFLAPTNDYQLSVLRLASEVLPSRAAVFDGAGTLLTRPDAYPFHWVLWRPEVAAYHEGKLPPLVPTLRQNRCRLLIDTYRVRCLRPEDRLQLRGHFVRLWGPLCVPGYDSVEEIDRQPRTIELWYDGLYEANRPDLLVDGEPMAEPRVLSAGTHTIALPQGRGRATLREISRTRDLELPEDTVDPGHFLGTYGYGY